MTELSPELRFVCACCRWPDDEPRRSGLAEAAAEVSDWDEVARLAREHRVEGLVAQGAALVGRGERFAATAERVKRRALADLAETVRVTRALDSAGLDHAILKGLPLGLRAFGTPVIKQSWDIDVLVVPADAVRAAETLSGVGYVPRIPARPLTDAEFRRWSPVSKEAVFDSPAGRTVELHWGLSDHPMLLDGVGVGLAGQPVELLEGASVQTLSDPANLAYLAVHGAYHGWSRLKWLADFSAFLASEPADGRAELIEQARACRSGHALDQALLLALELFGMRLEQPAAGPAVRPLVDLAMVAVDRRGRAADFDSDPQAQAAIRAIQRRLMPGARYRLIGAQRRLRGSEDRRLIALPAGFHWAYWAIRPFSAIFRRVLRAAHR